MNKHFQILAFCLSEIVQEMSLLDTDMVDLKKFGTKKFFLKKNNLIELHQLFYRNDPLLEHINTLKLNEAEFKTYRVGGPKDKEEVDGSQKFDKLISDKFKLLSKDELLLPDKAIQTMLTVEDSKEQHLLEKC